MARPSFRLTDEQRLQIKSMAAMGTPQDQIARKMGCTAKTLRLHCRDELDLGVIEATYNVSKTLYQMATSGTCVAATIFWMKTRGGLKENPGYPGGELPPPPFIVKQEEAPA